MAGRMQSLTIHEARGLLSKYMKFTPDEEAVSLPDALGRRLAVDAIALESMPGFDHSTRDGFALRAEDTINAGDAQPVILKITGEVRMGQDASLGGMIEEGQTWRIPTGGMLPPGVNAVVMNEEVQVVAGEVVVLTKPAFDGQYIIRTGEDIEAGALIAPAGSLLRPQDLGLMAAVGIEQVSVIKPLNVGIITSGDELTPIGVKPGLGQVRNSNAYTLHAQVCAAGGTPSIYGIVKDDAQLMLENLKQILSECDIAVLTGGTSVGIRDFSEKVLSDLGSPGLLFHGLAIQPGRPALGAVVDGKPILGLPGQPAAAMVVFELLGAPLLKYGTYMKEELEFPVDALLAGEVLSPAGVEEYLQVRLYKEGGYLIAEPVLGKRGLVSNLVWGDGLARIPAEMLKLPPGTRVNVKLY